MYTLIFTATLQNNPSEQPNLLVGDPYKMTETLFMAARKQ